MCIPHRTLEVGETVKFEYGDIVGYGMVTEVNDPDQGDFEYYVVTDNGQGSYWPRECLTPINSEAL